MYNVFKGSHHKKQKNLEKFPDGGEGSVLKKKAQFKSKKKT